MGFFNLNRKKEDCNIRGTGHDTKAGNLTKIILYLVSLAVLFGVIDFLYLNDRCWIDFSAIDIRIAEDVSKSEIILIGVLSLGLYVLLAAGFIFRKKFAGRKWITPIYLLITPWIQFLCIQGVLGYFDTFMSEYLLANMLILYGFDLLFLVFFDNKKLGITLANSILLLILLINYFVRLFKGTMVLLQDVLAIRTAMEVSGGYVFSFDYNAALFLLLFTGFIMPVFCLPVLSLRINWIDTIVRKLASVAAFIAVIAAFTLGPFSDLFYFDYWDTQSTYETNGFPVAIIAQFSSLYVEKPEGYSAEAVKEIADKYAAIYDEQNADDLNSASSVTKPVNVICIMDESWADLRNLGDFSAGDSILTYYDSMEENVIKGFVNVPVLGGGTANTEFSFLETAVMNFAGQSTYPYQIYANNFKYSIATVFKEQGYSVIGAHPFYATGWNRNNVYPALGFTTTYFLENWPNESATTTRYGFISDESFVETLISLSEEEEGYNFIFGISMQNHGGYADPNFTSTVTLTEGDYPKAEQYLSSLQMTDAALETLITYYEASDEPTMIIMFGDHLASLESEFYSTLLSKNERDEDSIEYDQLMYETPFLIWTNYDTEEESDAYMSVNYLGVYAMEMAGLELTDYYKAVLTIMEELPVIGNNGTYRDARGNWYDDDTLPEEYAEMVNDYKILQYNLINDPNNRVDSVFSLQD